MKQIDQEVTQERLNMIKDSVHAIVVAEGDFSRIRQLRFTALGVDPLVWQLMGDMGWLGLRLPEADGGVGLGLLEVTTLMEGLGEGLVPEPLIEGLLSLALLPEGLRDAALNGETLTLPVALGEATAAISVVNGVLQGTARHVPLANAASGFLLSTPQGLAFILKEAVAIETVMAQDGTHLGSFSVDGIVPEWLAVVDDAVIQGLVDEASLASSAYLLGVMAKALALTLSYLAVRTQFGRVIGSFQVLQHRAVDLHIQVELTRAIVRKAAAFWDQTTAAGLADDPDRILMRQRLVSIAKIRAAEAALLVTREAIQLHGGVGYTDETDIGLFLRKAMTWLNRYGSVEAHRQRYIHLSRVATTVGGQDD